MIQATKRIFYKDMGQHCLYWDINSQGVVQSAGPYTISTEIYKGRVLKQDPEQIKPGDQLINTDPVTQIESSYRPPVAKVWDLSLAIYRLELEPNSSGIDYMDLNMVNVIVNTGPVLSELWLNRKLYTPRERLKNKKPGSPGINIHISNQKGRARAFLLAPVARLIILSPELWKRSN